MSNFQIVCTDQVPETGHPRNERIIAVGVSEDGEKANRRLTVEEVVDLMAKGHRFYTQGPESGKVATVEKYWCRACSGWHIRTAADAVTDNNLDSLRYCRWKQ